MNEMPIIVKFESQSCVLSYPVHSGYATILTNVAVDKQGYRWQFFTKSICRDDGTQISSIDYGFTRLGIVLHES